MQCSAMSLLCHYEIGELLFVNFSCYCWTTTLILTERKTCMNVQSKPSFQATSVIITRNSYIAPNQTRLAQSTSHFKTRMDIRINTWNIHTPDDPTPTAKRRQTCTHPGTISATQTFTAAIHGLWKHLMIANQIQRALKVKPGFYWNILEIVYLSDFSWCWSVTDK